MMNFKKHLLLSILMISGLSGFSQITPQWKAVTGGLMSYFYPGKSPLGFDTLWNAQTIRGYVGGGFVHRTGNINETVTGDKTYTGNAIFTAGNIDGLGLAFDQWRRAHNNVTMKMILPSDTSLTSLMVITPSRSMGTIGRLTAGKLQNSLFIKDTLVTNTSVKSKYASLALGAYIDNTLGNDTSRFYGIRDTTTLTNVSHYKFLSTPNSIEGKTELSGDSSRNMATTAFIKNVASGYEPLLGPTAANTSPPFNRNILFYGSSLTRGTSAGGVTLTSQTYAYITATTAGYTYNNYGVSGRSLQQLTPGDNSLYSDMETFARPTNASDILVLECMVNDIVKPAYDVSTYTTQLTAVVNYCISTLGWPANKILIYNPSYYTTTTFGQTGISAKHTAYTNAASAIATSLGTLYHDGWDAMEAAAALAPPNTYLYTDNLHMTPAGQAFAGADLVAYLDTAVGGHVNYTNTISGTVGNWITTGNMSIYGNTSLTNATFSSGAVMSGTININPNDNKGAAAILGTSLYLGKLNSIPVGTNAIGGIAVSNNSGNGASGVYPFNTNLNMVYYARTVGGSASDHAFVTFGAGNVNAVRAYLKGSTGEFTVGYSDGLTHAINGSLLNINGGASFTASVSGSGTRRFVSSTPAFTPTANNTIQVGSYFAPTATAGTGALTSTASGTTGAADGTVTAQPTVTVTGTGIGATYTVTTVGGSATVVTMVAAGTGYSVGDTFTIAALPGITFTVATLGYTGVSTYSAQFANAPIMVTSITAPANLVTGMLWNQSGIAKFQNTSTNRIAMQSDANASNGQVPVYNASQQLVATTATGTGSPVLATSPTLVTPALGTPSAAVLTNATGLPLTTGVTGTLGATNGGTAQSTYTTGDILYASATNILSKRAIGSTNQVLTVIGGVPTWQTPSTGLTNPMTTLGDIIYGGASGAATRLAGNTTSTMLFLQSTGSGGVATAPTFYDLFGNFHNWTASQTISGGNLSLTQTSVGSNGTIFFSDPSAFSINLGPATVGTRTYGSTYKLRDLPNGSHGGTVAILEDIPTSGHTIFTPTTGGTITLDNYKYNIINPAGTIATLTVTMPSSPADNDTVYIKYTQAVTAVTYSGGTVVGGIISPVAGGLVVLTYDSGTTSWY